MSKGTIVVLVIAICGVIGWFAYPKIVGPSTEDIGMTVKKSMQATFDTDPDFSKVRLIVQSVSVIKKSGNEYNGMAVIQYKGVDRNVDVEVTANDTGVIWKVPPGGFSFIISDAIQEAAKEMGQ